MKKYEVILKLQLVDAVNYQNGVQFGDDVTEVQQNAIDSVIDFCKNYSNITFIDNDDFQGSTSLNEGYTENVTFTVKTDLDEELLKKALDELKSQIEYGYDIYTVED